MRREILDLKELATKVRRKDDIVLTNKKTIPAKELIIIKRDGREEPYNINKMRKVVAWACEDNKYLIDDLLKSTEIKMYHKIKIQDLYDELIKTAANKISLLNPDWEYISSKLYLMKVYKETWDIKNGDYPHLQEVLDKGIRFGIYDRKYFEEFSEEEINELNDYIVRKRDYLFTYKSLYLFFDKYCLNYSKTKKLELPQFSYMRVAMSLNYNISNKKQRIEIIKKLYDNLSNHQFTLATPIMLNAATKNANLASCVLSRMGDDSDSILDTYHNLGIYSKNKGGTAVDISLLRAAGSYIKGNQGQSSGAVPFIKGVESIMKAWNQGGKRPGSCVVYFQWWHYDVLDLIVLKNNGGTDENRARGLKYAVKLNNIFLDRIEKGEEVTLFDPKDVPELFDVTGEEFEKHYVEYETRIGIKRTRIDARKLWHKIMKERVETGNIYLFHEENVNSQNMLKRYINSSNLCVEITEPSRPSILREEELMVRENGTKQIVKKYDAGEISLCNLASLNLYEFYNMSDEDKKQSVETLLRVMDNAIDIQYYPVKEGLRTNREYRYIGIGVNNFQNLLAQQEINFESQEALEFTAKVFDEFSYLIISASAELAAEKGPYPEFQRSAWAEGNLPITLANKNALKLTEYQPDMDKWFALSQKIQKTGVRFALHMAIAPTATSGKAINATESIEPITNFFYKDEGTTVLPTVAPNFRTQNRYYKRAFEIDQKWLIKLAAIRQIYLDQSQSVNLYYPKAESLLQLTDDHLYAFWLGMKTFYYLKSEKDKEEEVCESCT
jgi:ribonucleoside-diphosphate reductase alpha chain